MKLFLRQAEKAEGPKVESKRFMFGLLLLAFLVAAVGLVCLHRPTPPRVVILPIPEGWPTPKRSLSARLMAKAPMWFWRFRQALFGSPKSILLDSAIFELRAWPASGLLGRSLGTADFTNTNGL